MRSLASALLIAVVLASATAYAQTSGTSCNEVGSACETLAKSLPADSICDVAYWKNEIDQSKPGAASNFQDCTWENTDANTAENRCCTDPCRSHSGTQGCSKDRNCAALPQTGSGSSSNPAICVSKDKLCSLLSVGTGEGNPSTNPCGLYGFCTARDGVCVYTAPTSGASGAATLAPGEGVGDKCGALHPMVIAMLALMFVTLVGGIILVGVVVVLNQKRADAEEAENGKNGRRTHM